MATHPLAGKPAPPESLIDVSRLENDYYSLRPDPDNPTHQVSFGTSGHRGSASSCSFNEAHILAITQAICDYRRQNGIDGPILVGKDTHALSRPAERTAIEVLVANEVDTVLQKDDGYTPTPSISRAILTHNVGRRDKLADGIVITPSHNPPSDGGFKYNPPDGGPADTGVTNWIQDKANHFLKEGLAGIKRVACETSSSLVTQGDFLTPYVDDLDDVIDFDVIRSAGLKIGVDPMGGAAVHYWRPIAERFGIDLTVVNSAVDPRFAFMTLDHDGKIRMDCSSPYAMAGLVRLKDSFDIAFGNDADTDRHGIVAPSSGLMNPNHYLAVAIRYLLTHRHAWPVRASVGKTLVSSQLIDRVVDSFGRKLFEVPVGFKWFVEGLLDGTCCFGGEESAGASFLRKNGTVWTTDKDGIILGLLAAEITAKTGRDPGLHYQDLTAQFGTPYYRRVDQPVSLEEKAAFKHLTAERVTARELAGDPIMSKLTHAPGNGASIGGLKVVTRNGWFAARPSGTESLFKLYAESFVDEAHLLRMIEDARSIVARALEN
jgi:phosphoglucomutase